MCLRYCRLWTENSWVLFLWTEMAEIVRRKMWETLKVGFLERKTLHLGISERKTQMLGLFERKLLKSHICCNGKHWCLVCWIGNTVIWLFYRTKKVRFGYCEPKILVSFAITENRVLVIVNGTILKFLLIRTDTV